ncbi:hypothetical protein [Streptomyces canus]|uniref:hypothetical protein n=1 Tax=Streptomyces canus TaxID=58343 RepID=UPI002E2870AD|nr:hypothetical protein [Streptomyces canus]
MTTTGVFHDERDDNAWNWRFAVPGPGTYTVTVNRMSGRTVNVTHTAKLTIEDWLMVSIGDSAASGEGNPDVPGTPSGFDPDLSIWDVFVPGLALYHLSKGAYKWADDALDKAVPQLARHGHAKIAMNPAPVWQEPLAHRSLRSGHAHAAALLEDRAKGRVITFLPFGRTGSEIPMG